MNIWATVSSWHHIFKWLYICFSAPVSEPAISQTCLSPEQKTVSCFSEGDEVEFTLSLHDNSLIQTRPKKTDKHNVLNIAISLHGQLMGNLTCIVQNNVSREQRVIRLRSCTGRVMTFFLSEYLLKYIFFWFVYFVVAIWYKCVLWFILQKKRKKMILQLHG